jgi:hypothetical protein
LVLQKLALPLAVAKMSVFYGVLDPNDDEGNLWRGWRIFKIQRPRMRERGISLSYVTNEYLLLGGGRGNRLRQVRESSVPKWDMFASMKVRTEPDLVCDDTD